jgi:hypothetical protein
VLIREAELADVRAVVRLVSALLSELRGRPLPEHSGTAAYMEIVSNPSKGFVLLGEAKADSASVSVKTS